MASPPAQEISTTVNARLGVLLIILRAKLGRDENGPAEEKQGNVTDLFLQAGEYSQTISIKVNIAL